MKDPAPKPAREQYVTGYSIGHHPPTVMDSMTGIIPSMVEAEMDRSYPDVFVCAVDTADTVVYGLPKVSSKGSGAGLSLQSAQKAAIGEGIERYACCIMHPEDLVLGSWNSLHDKGYQPVKPESWALFDESQHGMIPFPKFDRNTTIAWTQAQSITFQRECLVPACMVYMPYDSPLQDSREKVIAPSISTGCACAESYTESLLKGVCELVERESFMIMWRNRLPLPRVEIDSNSALFPIFNEKFLRPGLEYTLVYTTLDLPIPSFFGMLRDANADPPGIIVGGAAHPDPSKAALKVLLELVQGLKWRDHIGPQAFKAESDFSNIRSFDDRYRLYAFNDLSSAFDFIGAKDTIRLSDIKSQNDNNLRAVFDRVVKDLWRRGLETIAVDLTPIDASGCGLYVTRVMVPGCEVMEGDHNLQFLGGSRWREVPYRMGLTPKPADVSSINPYPHPYP